MNHLSTINWSGLKYKCHTISISWYKRSEFMNPPLKSHTLTQTKQKKQREAWNTKISQKQPIQEGKNKLLDIPLLEGLPDISIKNKLSKGESGNKEPPTEVINMCMFSFFLSHFRGRGGGGGGGDKLLIHHHSILTCK